MTERLQRGAIYLLLAAMPVLFVPQMYVSYELPKMVFFRSVVVGVAALWLCQGIYRGTVRVPRIASLRPVQRAFLLICGALGVVTIFSIAPQISLFGSYVRLQGALSWFFYLLFFVMVLVTFTDHAAFRRAGLWLMGGVVVSMVYAIFQNFGWDFSGVDLQRTSLGRVISGMGHPNYLASYIVLCAFPLLAWLHKKPMWACLVGSGMVYTLFLTGSRAGMLGFLAGCLVYAILASKSLRIVTVLVCLCITAMVVSGRFTLQEGTEESRSLHSRFIIWDAAQEAAFARPLFGYGLDTFSLVFSRMSTGNLAQYERSSTVPDRAHNLFLDILTQGGFVGLGAFLYGVWVLLRLSWRTMPTLSAVQRTQAAGVLAGIGALFVSDQFGFSMTAHFAVLMFLLAYLFHLFSGGKWLRLPMPFRGKMARQAGYLMVMVCVVGVLAQGVIMSYADVHLLRGWQRWGHSREEGLSHFAEAAGVNRWQNYIDYVYSSALYAQGEYELAYRYAVLGRNFAGGEDGYGYYLGARSLKALCAQGAEPACAALDSEYARFRDLMPQHYKGFSVESSH